MAFTSSVEDFSNFALVDGLSGVVKFEFVAASPHSEDFEPVDLGDEFWCALRSMLRIALNKTNSEMIKKQDRKIDKI